MFHAAADVALRRLGASGFGAILASPRLLAYTLAFGGTNHNRTSLATAELSFLQRTYGNLAGITDISGEALAFTSALIEDRLALQGATAFLVFGLGAHRGGAIFASPSSLAVTHTSAIAQIPNHTVGLAAHHSLAVLRASWVITRSARPAVQALALTLACLRILHRLALAEAAADLAFDSGTKRVVAVLAVPLPLRLAVAAALVFAAALAVAIPTAELRTGLVNGTDRVLAIRLLPPRLAFALAFSIRRALRAAIARTELLAGLVCRASWAIAVLAGPAA
jgi:hypothetical protein